MRFGRIGGTLVIGGCALFMIAAAIAVGGGSVGLIGGLLATFLGSMVTVAVVAGVTLVGASWILLLLVALARAIGARPMARRSSRWIIRGAAFLGVLGGCLAAWLVVDVAVGMSHFDSGIPPDQEVLLIAGFWVALIGGWVLGTLAARRVRPGPATDIRAVR
jgi:hypothetical protein